MNTIRISIAKFTRLTDGEYNALVAHPYSRKSLDSYRRVGDSEWDDYSLLNTCIRDLSISTGHYRVCKQDNVLDANENKWGVFAEALYNAIPNFNSCNFDEYKWYPVTQEALTLLNALGYKVNIDDDSSMIAVMFSDEKEL